MILAVLLPGMVSFAQLTGVKTVPGNYATLAAAIAALNSQGVGSGGVTFNVASGYTETFTSPTAGNITTTTGSAANPIVFQKSGTGADPIITAYFWGTTYATSAVIRLVGTDYVTFDGIDVAENPLNVTYKTNWGYAILMASATDASQHIQIKNCAITLDKTNTSSRGIYSQNHNALTTTSIIPTDPAGTVSYCDVDNCTISNVYSGIYFTGYNATSPYTLCSTSNRFGYTTGNLITNFGGGGSAVYGIYTIYEVNVTVARNTIIGGAGSTSTLNGIYLNISNNSNMDIYLNTVTLNSSAAGTNAIYGIYNAGSGVGTTNTVNIYHNTVENCTQPNAGNSNWYLINNGGYALNENVYDNVVRNNNKVSTGGSVYMIYLSGATIGTENVYNNNVYGDTLISGSTTVFYAFYCNNQATVKNVYQNKVSGIYTVGSSVYGLFYSFATTGAIYQNSIAGITENNSSGMIYGIKINTGTTINCYNNLISDLRNPASTSNFALRGFSVEGGTNIGLYYNTIYLTGTSTGTNFGSTCVYATTSPYIEMKNNLLVNATTPTGTGNAIAYWRSTTTLGTYVTTSDHNNFYAGAPGAHNLIFYNGTTGYQSLADYKTVVSPADANSFTELPPFINAVTAPYDLHISTLVKTQCESGAVIVSTPVNITTDYDGTSRYPNGAYPKNPDYLPTAPDAGAFEFAGIPADLVPPSIIFTQFQNTSMLSSRTLTATISDPSGVPVSGTGRPVLYWKKNSGAYSAVTGTNVPSTNNFTFTFGDGVSLGDTVSYYIVAQDLVVPSNVGSNPSAGASGYTSSPPACSIPPTAPASYRIIQSISGDITVGTGGIYPSLTGVGGFFQDINSKVVTGNIHVKIISDLTEDGTNPLNKTVEDLPGNFQITISPDAATERLISGTISSAMIRFVGASRVNIDGRYNGAGKYLRFRNLSTAFADIELINDSRFDTIRDCYWESGNAATAPGAMGIIRIYNSTGSTGNSNNVVMNNVIRDLSDGTLQPNTSIYLGGSSSAYNLSNVISGNEVLNFTAYGIYVSSYNKFVVLSGNSLYNNLAVPLTTTVRGIYFIAGTGSEANIISGNYIGGSAAMCGGTPWLHNSTGGIYGIYLSTGIVIPTEVYNNVYTNIRSIKTTGTGAFYGIYCNSGACHVGGLGGNIIGSATTPNSIIFDGTNGFYGIYQIVANPDMTVVNNIVGNITWTVTSGTQTSIYGIMVYGGVARKNKVFNFTSTQTGFVPTMYGIYNSGASGYTTEISNNIVDLDAGLASDPILYGLYDNAASTCFSAIYYNTVHVHGPATTTSSTYAFYKNGSAPNAISDNIFFNNRAAGGTGYHYGFYNKLTAAITSDYNDIYSVSGTVGYYTSTIITSFPAWQTATTGDVHSVSVNPNFVSATDLHPTSGSLNSAGVAITGITTDYNGITRGTPPDMGALEFQAVPVIVTTNATSLTTTTAVLNGTANAQNESAAISFEYGLTTAYGNTVVATPSNVTGMVTTPVTAAIGSLLPNTTYHFRAVGTINSVITNGNDMTFKTSCAPVDPAGAITGPASVCPGSIGNVYSINPIANATDYVWSVPEGASITGGANTTSITVTFGSLPGNVSVYGTSSCATGSSSTVAVTLSPLPAAAGTISGPALTAQGHTGIAYSVPAISDATGYTWNLPSGATIATGANTNSITVDFSPAAVSGVITVYGTNGCGNGVLSPELSFTVIPLSTAVQNVTVADGQVVCYNAMEVITVAGNGTTFTIGSDGSATMIAGQKILYEPGTLVISGGYMHGMIATNNQYCGGLAPSMVTRTSVTESTPDIQAGSTFKVYPNPTTGNFTIEANGTQESGVTTVNVYTLNGVMVLSGSLQDENRHTFSASALVPGIYLIRMTSGNHTQISKLIKL